LTKFSALVVKQLATLGAVDERDLQDRFQLLDAGAECGLRHVTGFCGAAETAVIVKRRQCRRCRTDGTFIIEVSDHSGRKFSLDALQQNVYFTRPVVVGLN
jgi:hypothetical protein